MFKHDAIVKLYPNVRTIRGDIAYDDDDNEISYDNNAVMFEAGLIELRYKRNNLLKECDWRILPDSPIADKTAWENYRTQLRDITNGLTTLADVESVVWPERPVE